MDKRESTGNALVDKSFEFAKAIVNFHRILQDDKQFEIASQLIRSGTSIGANSREAQRAESKRDFKHKLKIALKEADESMYWLELINETIVEVPSELYELNEELVKLLVKIIVNTKD